MYKKEQGGVYMSNGMMLLKEILQCSYGGDRDFYNDDSWNDDWNDY